MEDGFEQIGRMDPDRVKGRLRIQYVNEAGLAEAGIDGGGLFKDFMEELLRQGFSPQVFVCDSEKGVRGGGGGKQYGVKDRRACMVCCGTGCEAHMCRFWLPACGPCQHQSSQVYV